MRKRLLETLAMLTIGDGVLGIVNPEGHVRLWKIGPSSFQKILEPFLEHQNMTRLAGAFEVGFGIWLALMQETE